MDPKPPRIGLYVSQWHTVSRDMLRGAQAAAARHGWGTYAPWPGQRVAWPDPRRLHLSGLVLSVGKHLDPAAHLGHGLPCVTLGTQHTPQTRQDVTWDNHAAGRLAAEHLLDRGHRRFAAVLLPRMHYQVQRCEGFRDALDAHGHAVEFIDADPAAPVRLARRLARAQGPVGVFCANDLIGSFLLRWAKRLGQRVPESIAVVGVGNDEVHCEMTDPPISSVVLPGELAGAAAVHRLARLLDGRPQGPPDRIAPTYVAVRHSSDTLAVDDPEVVRALRAIRRSATQGLDPGGVHRAATVSRRALEIRFRDAVGRSIGEEIARVQVEAAKRLLAETDLPIADVAHRSGFASAQRFAVRFRQLVGRPARDYRRGLRVG